MALAPEKEKALKALLNVSVPNKGELAWSSTKQVKLGSDFQKAFLARAILLKENVEDQDCEITTTGAQESEASFVLGNDIEGNKHLCMASGSKQAQDSYLGLGLYIVRCDDPALPVAEKKTSGTYWKRIEIAIKRVGNKKNDVQGRYEQIKDQSSKKVISVVLSRLLNHLAKQKTSVVDYMERIDDGAKSAINKIMEQDYCNTLRDELQTNETESQDVIDREDAGDGFPDVVPSDVSKSRETPPVVAEVKTPKSAEGLANEIATLSAAIKDNEAEEQRLEGLIKQIQLNDPIERVIVACRAAQDVHVGIGAQINKLENIDNTQLNQQVAGTEAGTSDKILTKQGNLLESLKKYRSRILTGYSVNKARSELKQLRTSIQNTTDNVTVGSQKSGMQQVIKNIQQWKFKGAEKTKIQSELIQKCTTLIEDLDKIKDNAKKQCCTVVRDLIVEKSQQQHKNIARQQLQLAQLRSKIENRDGMKKNTAMLNDIKNMEDDLTYLAANPSSVKDHGSDVVKGTDMVVKKFMVYAAQDGEVMIQYNGGAIKAAVVEKKLLTACNAIYKLSQQKKKKLFNPFGGLMNKIDSTVARVCIRLKMEGKVSAKAAKALMKTKDSLAQLAKITDPVLKEKCIQSMLEILKKNTDVLDTVIDTKGPRLGG